MWICGYMCVDIRICGCSWRGWGGMCGGEGAGGGGDGVVCGGGFSRLSMDSIFVFFFFLDQGIN